MYIPRFTASLALLSILFVTSCGSGDPAEQEAARGPAPAVVVTEVQQKTVPLFTEYVARTEAFESVEIRARVEGVLEKAHFADGTMVKSGQLLFTIEPRPYEAAVQDARASLSKAAADLHLAEQQVELIKAKAGLAQAEASYIKAEQDVERLRPLAAEAAVPQQELDAAIAAEAVARAEVDAAQATVQNTELTTETYVVQAEAAIEAAKAAVTQAELDLSYTKISSPLSGQVGRRLIDPGNLVGRGESTLLATVAANNPIKAVFGMSETDYLTLTKRTLDSGKDMSDVTKERIIEMVLADDTVFPEKGWFSAVENIIDPQTGTLTIETLFPNPRRLLRAGQFARVRFPVSLKQDAVLVPRRAILRLQGVDSVYKVSADNKVSLHTVALEADFEEYSIATSGVEPGDRIVLEGHQKVRPGMSITPAAQSTTAQQRED